MEIINTRISGLALIQNVEFDDSRGSFTELYSHRNLRALGVNMGPAKQVNLSHSHKAALRGIHYSLAPKGQQKFVTALSGSFYDLVIDLRENSPTYLEFESFYLQSGSNECLFIDSGLGHSVLSLEDNSKLLYLLSSEYNPELEKGLNPLDPNLGIDWPIEPELISEKDSMAPSLKELKEMSLLPVFRGAVE